MTNKVSVIGLGYVGLPLAALCASKGHDTVGLDSNALTVEALTAGRCPIRDAGVEALLETAVASGRFHATGDPADIAGCTVHLICVPTPVDNNQEPDLAPLLGALDVLTPHIKSGDLVVVESTVFPGTCEQVVVPVLEAATGLRAGSDFELAHCPERVNPGDAFWTSANIPRVIGATTPDGTARAAEFYAGILGGAIFDVRDIRASLRPKFVATDEGYSTTGIPQASVTMMRSIRDAEAVKAMENTVRDVNIAFVNELAKISDVLDLDVVDIIDGMSTKPFGKGPFFPGVGVGGHCIAVDPEWLKAASQKAGYMPELIQLSRKTNNGMPAYTIGLLQDALNERGLPLKGSRVAVIGVAYKRNVDDLRESPFFEIRRLLEKKGALLNVYDSWVSEANTSPSLQEAVRDARAILIVTDHDDAVAALTEMDLSELPVEVLIDGRNCLDGAKVTAQGVLYRGVGRRSSAL